MQLEATHGLPRHVRGHGDADMNSFQTREDLLGQLHGARKLLTCASILKEAIRARSNPKSRIVPLKDEPFKGTLF